MAVTLVHTCPHCQTEKAGFTLVGEAPIPNEHPFWHVFFQCNICFGPLAVRMYNGIGAAPSKLQGELTRLTEMHNFEYFPKSQPSTFPGHTPDAVARAFVQAEDAIKRQHWEAAGAMDRRALELATKDMAPDYAELTLYKRIEKLAEIGKLTESLKDWAHGLRLVGNDAMHEIDGLDEAEATQAHELTRFILIYLYTLPIDVMQARATRESSE